MGLVGLATRLFPSLGVPSTLASTRSPKKWLHAHLQSGNCTRQTSLVQRKGPLQLDLFDPRDTQFEYKVVVTNKTTQAAAIVEYHNGRGAQEAVFGEAKSAAALEYIPTRSLVANQLFLVAAIFAHNLGREMQWQAAAEPPRTTPNRVPSIPLRALESLRKQVFQRAGRLTRPQGRLVLTISANPAAKEPASNVRHTNAAKSV